MKEHGLRARLAVEALLFVSAVAIPLSVARADILTHLFGEPPTVAAQAVAYETSGPSDIRLLSADQNPDPVGGRGGAELWVDEHSLKSNGPIGADEIEKHGVSSGEIRVYVVQEGDDLSRIAEMFDVTVNTIMWANEITKATSIQPGDELVILPIAGVRHVVKRGDTVASIAKKYEGNEEEIISYNQLESASDLTIGDTIIIPGGAMHVASAKTVKGAQPTKTSGGGGGGGFIHPAPGAIKTQGIHGYNAVDLAANSAIAIRAALGGEVIVAKGSGWNGGYGNYIVIRHSNGTQTLYAHLEYLNVGVGEYVEQGQSIGAMGNTGRSTGRHLHFEVRGARNPF